MKPTRDLKIVFAATIIGVCLNSCINNDYDLSNLSNKIEIFDNSLSLPIGTAKIYLDSVLSGNGVDTSILNVKDGIYHFNYSGGMDLSNMTNTLQDFKLNKIEGSTNSITIMDATGKPVPYSFPVSNYSYSGSMAINLPTFDTELIDVDSVLLKNTMLKVNFETQNLQWDMAAASASVTFTPTGNNADYYIDNQKVTSWTINIGETKYIEIRKLRLNSGINTLTINRVANFSIKQPGGLIATQATQSYLDITAAFPNGANASQVWGKVDYQLHGSINPIEFDAFGKLMKENDVLGLYNPTIQVTTTGNIGVPFNIGLNIKSQNTNTGLTRELNNTNFSMEAAESPEITKVNTFLMDKSNGTSELFKINPNKLLMSYDIISDKNSVKSHFIGEQSTMDVKWQMDVPLQFSKDFHISLGETIENPIGDLKKIGEQEDLNVSLTLNVKNRIPLNLKLQLTALDADSSELFTTESGTIAAASPINSTTGFATGFSTTETELSLSPEQITLLSSTTKFRIDFIVTSNQQSEFVTVQPSDYIDIIIGAKIIGGVILNMNENKNSGYTLVR
jgi:hypothetical protein